MKKIILLFSIVGLLAFGALKTNAETGYLEAKDYVSINSTEDVSADVTQFINICSQKNKDAFFNSGTYHLHNNIILKSDVSILGDENVIFKGVNGDYQVHLLDDGGVSSIEIKNIVFDNVTIYSRDSNSLNWQITENIFTNAKKVDTSIDSGLVPDSNNKNGGESTGYYILRKNQAITINSNLFLRDEHSLGRGIGIYKTSNVVIEDNYFGLLEDIDQSIVSAKTKALKKKVLALKILDSTSNQGYFMTCINVINNDTNTKIVGNHFSLNKDITEVQYEDGSQTTKGYHRDHFIYAKEYEGLSIIGNYFKGMNKNADGGIKCRNGNDLIIYKNVLEDTMILLYVQQYSVKNYLTNVYIKENRFINRDYTSELLSLNDFTQATYPLNKYPTVDYLFLIKNYVSNAIIDNITIEDNLIYSCGILNEEIRVDNTKYSMPTNLSFVNNLNAVNQTIRTKIWNTKDLSNQTINEDYTNGTKYVANIDDSYEQIDVDAMSSCNDVDYYIEGKTIVSDGKIYLNNQEYQNEVLHLGTKYFMLIEKETTSKIVIEQGTYEIPSKDYTIVSFEPSVSVPKSIQLELGETIDLTEYLVGFKANISLVTSTDVCEIRDGVLKANQCCDTLIKVSIGGFEVDIELIVQDEKKIDDFTVSDVEKRLSESAKLDLVYDKAKEVIFEYTYDSTAMHLDENTLELTFYKTGSYALSIKELRTGITKSVDIIVSKNDLTYETQKTIYFLEERFSLKVFVNGVESNAFSVTGLQREQDKFFSNTMATPIWIVDNADKTNRLLVELAFKHYYQFTTAPNISLFVQDTYALTYSLKTSNPNYVITYEVDSEYLEVSSTGVITAKKAGQTTLKVLIDGEEISEINVEIGRNINHNYSWIWISGIIVVVLVIFTIIILLRKRLCKYDRSNKTR